MDQERLREEYLRVTHRMGKLRMTSAAALLTEVTQLELLALERLSDTSRNDSPSKGMYVSTLARNLRVSPPAVSRMLRGMEGKGLITRTVDEANRRNTYILLTEKGKAVRERSVGQMEEFFKHVFIAMGEDDALQFLKLWNRYVDLMEAELSRILKGEREC
ncbi:MAG: hypothetical protein H6Q60_938 [Oscillospiraceae bacterium]|nr:hypothetical protein [Oscillospiraceae bacterium]